MAQYIHVVRGKFQYGHILISSTETFCGSIFQCVLGYIDQLIREYLWLNIYAYIVSAHQNNLWQQYLYVYSILISSSEMFCGSICTRALSLLISSTEILSLWLSRPWLVHSSWLPQIGNNILICWNMAPSRTMESCLQIGESSPPLLSKL